MASYGSSAKPASGYTPDSAKAALVNLQSDPIIIPPTLNRGLFGGLIYTLGHKITTTVGDINIADQEAEPTKPADKNESFSTYGVVIPRSMGRRRLGGNVIECSTITSAMVGAYDYYVDYQIPITQTDELQGGIHPDNGSSLDWDWGESNSQTQTVRIFQDNDDTSDNWVDVERYSNITLVDGNGVSHTFRFTLS